MATSVTRKGQVTIPKPIRDRLGIEPGNAVDVAMAMAEKVARQPPISVAMTKMTVNRLAYALDDLASHMDVDQFAIASKAEDHLEGVAAFLERRKPTFRGR